MLKSKVTEEGFKRQHTALNESFNQSEQRSNYGFSRTSSNITVEEN